MSNLPIKLILICTIVFSSCNGSQNPQRASVVKKSNDDSTIVLGSIPIEISGTLVFLQAKVNGSEPLWFVLDSGAEGLIINAGRARALGLKLEGKGRGGGAGENSYDLTFARDVTITLPGAELAKQTVTVTSLETIEPQVGRSIDGILGYHLLRQYTVEIDYAARVVRLYDPQKFRYIGTGESVPVTMKGGHSSISLKFMPQAGGLPLQANLLLDTGASAEAILNTHFVESHKLLTNGLRTIREPLSEGLGGRTQIRVGRAQSIRLGRLILEQPVIGFAQDRQGFFASKDFDGLIGGEVLRRFKLIFDYSRQRVIFEPNVHFAEPYEYGMSGLRLRAEGEDFKHIKVRDIVEDSPAAEAGLRVGDEIIEVDGRAVTMFTIDKFQRMFKLEGRKYGLSIRRGEEIKHVDILMRRLI